MLLFASTLGILLTSEPASAVFQRETIDTQVGAWGKAFLDVDGDGLQDLLVGGGELNGFVYWYRAPGWQRFEIGSSGGGDDLTCADMNGDGVKDVVVTGNPITWYENPRGSGGDPTAAWTPHLIESNAIAHDGLTHDFDGDGRLDVSVRSERGTTRIYFQESDGSFTPVVLEQSLEAAGGHWQEDVDGDGKLDIVGPGYWLRHPVSPRNGADWTRFEIATWPDGGAVGSGDFDHDGNVDIVLAPSETGPGTITWFEAPDDPLTGVWAAHPILAAEDVHRIRVVDFDQDGELDIAFAEMHQSPLDRVGVLHNDGDGTGFSLELLSTQGSHNIAVADADADGDLDILGANWDIAASPDGARLNLWRNQRDFAGRAMLDAWTPMVIASDKPDQVFGLAFGDVDGDGARDVATGRTWYANPGSLPANDWAETDLGAGFDAMLVIDVDGDGQLDVIAQGAPNGGQVPIVWLQPDDPAGGSFTPIPVGQIPADPGDGQSQGYAVASLLGPTSRDLVFSTVGIHALTIPANPATDTWPVTTVAPDAREEGFALADIDRDDDLDVVALVAPAGTTVAWWENEGAGTFTRHDLGTTSGIEGDRVAVADVDWDSRLDVVVTETNLQDTGNAVYWFRQPAVATDGGWTRTTIAGDLGSLNSMDVGDVDGDGRPDVVTGEHRGDRRVVVWENVDGGTTWTPHTVAIGDESHLGARLVDLDGNGARDIVNIGFDDPQFVRAFTVQVIPEPRPIVQMCVGLVCLALLHRRRHRRSLQPGT